MAAGFRLRPPERDADAERPAALGAVVGCSRANPVVDALPDVAHQHPGLLRAWATPPTGSFRPRPAFGSGRPRIPSRAIS